MQCVVKPVYGPFLTGKFTNMCFQRAFNENAFEKVRRTTVTVSSAIPLVLFLALTGLRPSCWGADLGFQGGAVPRTGVQGGGQCPAQVFRWGDSAPHRMERVSPVIRMILTLRREYS